ncbi:hypothetical protein ACVIHF_001207 [Bradyrhizobium sp. USDA 4506]
MITWTRPLHQLLGLVGQVLEHPVAAGDGGLVDMDARRRLARTTAADIRRALDALAHGVIEDEDTIRLQRRLQEGFHGRVVDVADFVLVVIVPHTGRMLDQRKALAVERETVGNQTPVKDRNIVGFGQRGGFGFAGRRIEGVGPGLARRRREIIQFSGHKRQRLDASLLKAHGDLPDSIVRAFDLGGAGRGGKVVAKIATLRFWNVPNGENPCRVAARGRMDVLNHGFVSGAMVRS